MLPVRRQGGLFFFFPSILAFFSRPLAPPPPNPFFADAHVVTDAKTLQVRLEGEFDKLEATILAVSHQTDLALVTLEDEG